MRCSAADRMAKIKLTGRATSSSPTKNTTAPEDLIDPDDFDRQAIHCRIYYTVKLEISVEN